MYISRAYRVLRVRDPGQLDVIGVGRGEDACRNVDDEDEGEARFELQVGKERSYDFPWQQPLFCLIF